MVGKEADKTMTKGTMETIIRDGLAYFLEYVYRLEDGLWIDQKNLSGLFGAPISNVSKGHLRYYDPLSLAVDELDI